MEQAMEATRTNTDTSGQSAHPDLRGWLQRLAATDRLAVARKGISLIDELAAVAKKLENARAVLFPAPGQPTIPVVANLARETARRVRFRVSWRPPPIHR